MKRVDVKFSTYIDSSTENNDKEAKFKTGDHVRMSKYKKIFAKSLFLIDEKTLLWLKKVKTLLHEHRLLMIFNCDNNC